QIQLLDREIDIRRERVAQAEKLAEQGNSEILKQEQERLDKAGKLREDAARKQLIINNALTLSNAILAVATAAGESGAGAIVIVPAVLAAIAAGYAFVRSLDTETGFKDGVVDFKGKGTETSDSNVVRISNGESV